MFLTKKELTREEIVQKIIRGETVRIIDPKAESVETAYVDVTIGTYQDRQKTIKELLDTGELGLDERHELNGELAYVNSVILRHAFYNNDTKD